MRISDWSSDVCSSDLAFGICAPRLNSLQPYYRRGQGADGTLRREQMTPMSPARLALAIQASLLLSFAGISSAQDAAPAEPTDQAQTLDTVTVTAIGRASCRERVCQYVYISGVAVSLKKKTNI